MDFKITEYNFISNKVSKQHTFVMLADLHNQQYGKDNKVLLDTIKKIKPEAIFIAGDMVVCREKYKQENLQSARTVVSLARIAPVYYGIGNHEAGIRNGSHNTGDTWKKYCEILKKSPDVHLLSNENLLLEDTNICVHGLDISPNHYKRFIKDPLPSEEMKSYLGVCNKDKFNILLAHHPDYFKEYLTFGADLILSGHNHGGLICLPWLGGVVSPRLHPFPKYDKGLFVSENHKTSMIVSSGMGMHSIHIRINNKPELIVIKVD